MQERPCPTSIAEAQEVPDRFPESHALISESHALPPAFLILLQTWDLDFVERWIKEHAADAARLGKPLLIEEFGKEVCFDRRRRWASATPSLAPSVPLSTSWDTHLAAGCSLSRAANTRSAAGASGSATSTTSVTYSPAPPPPPPTQLHKLRCQASPARMLRQV